MNRHAARAHLRDFEAVGGEFLGDALENNELPRGKLHHERHEHALAGKLPFAARAQMLFEQHAFVRDVLVNDPQSFPVHRDNEAGTYLAQWLEFAQAFGACQRFGDCTGGDVAEGAVMSGSPAFEAREWLRAITAFPKLPEVLKTVRQLEKRLERLEGAAPSQ